MNPGTTSAPPTSTCSPDGGVPEPTPAIRPSETATQPSSSTRSGAATRPPMITKSPAPLTRPSIYWSGPSMVIRLSDGGGPPGSLWGLHGLLERLERPAGGRLNGTLRDARGLRDFGLAQPTVVTQHQHLALAGRQLRQRADHRLVLAGEHREAFGGPRVHRVRRHVLAGGLAAAQHAARPVDHGGAQVADRGRGVPEPAPVAMQAGEGLLDDVFRRRGLVDQQDRQPDQPHPVLAVQDFEGQWRRRLSRGRTVHDPQLAEGRLDAAFRIALEHEPLPVLDP